MTGEGMHCFLQWKHRVLTTGLPGNFLAVSTVNGHLGHFQFLVIINNAMNISVYFLWWIYMCSFLLSIYPEVEFLRQNIYIYRYIYLYIYISLALEIPPVF